MLIYIVAIALLLARVECADFKCPTESITSGASKGRIPTDATGPVNVPAGTTCTISFQIPTGHVVKLKLSGINSDDSDEFVLTQNVIDSVIHTKSWFYVTNNKYKKTIWLPSIKSTQLQFSSPNGTLSILVEYSYINLNELPLQTVPTGTNISIPLMPERIHSLFSPNGNRLALNLDGELPRVAYIGKIYVYDSDNLSNAKIIGTLDYLLRDNKYKFNGSKMLLISFDELMSSNGVISVHDASDFNSDSKVASYKKKKVSSISLNVDKMELKESDKIEDSGERLRRTLNTVPLSQNAKFFDTHRNINNNMDDFDSKSVDTFRKVNTNLGDVDSKMMDSDFPINDDMEDFDAESVDTTQNMNNIFDDLFLKLEDAYASKDVDTIRKFDTFFDNVESQMMNSDYSFNDDMDDLESIDTLRKNHTNMDEIGSKKVDTVFNTILGIGIVWLIIWLILIILCVCGAIFLAVYLCKTQCTHSRYQAVNI